jgi:hypothetical protein
VAFAGGTSRSLSPWTMSTWPTADDHSAGACRPQRRRAVSCARYVPGLTGLSRPVVRSFSRAR